MKIKPKNLTREQSIATLDALYTAAGSLKDRASMKLFLRDLLTPSERVMLGRRILVARKLLANTSYENIRNELKVGNDTISRIERWLHDQLPGYEQAIKGLEREFEKRERQYESRASFARLKRKYPLHFLLFPWPKGFKPKN